MLFEASLMILLLQIAYEIIGTGLLFFRFVFWSDLQLFTTDLFLWLDFSSNSISHQTVLLHTPLTTEG